MLGKWTESQTYESFSTPLTSCSPGRWFVSQQLKLLIAYTALHYDIQPLEGKRPQSRVLGDSMVPPQNTVIKVRRR